MDALKNFWRWLKRANAKRVFYYSLACFLGVAGWWLWREFAPAASSADVQYGPPRRRQTAQIDVVQLMNQQLAVSAAISGDPFVLRSYKRPAWTWPRRPPTNTGTQSTGTVIRVVSPDHSPSANDKRPSVALIYHGMWILTDGSTGARIENRTKKSTSFHAPGGNLEWLSIGKVERDYVEIKSESGEITRLERGQPLIFRKMDDGE
jgi:hypothetical protein